MKDIAIHPKFRITLFHTAFRFSWDADFVFHGETHPHWELVFIEEGRVISTEDEKVYTLSEGHMILHAPMEFHRIRSASPSSPRGIIVSFLADGDLPEELKNGIFPLDLSEREEYRRIFDCIRDSARADASPYASQEAADRMALFLIRLGRETADHRLSSLAGTEEYRRIVSDMTEHVCDNLTLSKIASAHNISVSGLKLLFRTYAGISPKAYYNQLRIRHATDLLLQGHSVTEVAERMNFSSLNYFTVFFKKHVGIPPSEFRQTAHPPA